MKLAQYVKGGAFVGRWSTGSGWRFQRHLVLTGDVADPAGIADPAAWVAASTADAARSQTVTVSDPATAPHPAAGAVPAVRSSLDLADPVIVACSGRRRFLAHCHCRCIELPARIQPQHVVRRDGRPRAANRIRTAGRATAEHPRRAIGYRRAGRSPTRCGGPGGPEASARRARYGALLPARGTVGRRPAGCAVLLAHTADDQAETVLLGLAGGRAAIHRRHAAWRDPGAAPARRDARDTEPTCAAAGLLAVAGPTQ